MPSNDKHLKEDAPKTAKMSPIWIFAEYEKTRHYWRKVNNFKTKPKNKPKLKDM